MNALNQEIRIPKGSNKPLWEDRRGTNFVVYRDWIIGKLHNKNETKSYQLKGTASKWNEPPFLFHILIVDLMPGSGVISITLGIESFPP